MIAEIEDAQVVGERAVGMLSCEVETEPRQISAAMISADAPLQDLHLADDRLLLELEELFGKVVHRLVAERSRGRWRRRDRRRRPGTIAELADPSPRRLERELAAFKVDPLLDVVEDVGNVADAQRRRPDLLELGREKETRECDILVERKRGRATSERTLRQKHQALGERCAAKRAAGGRRTMTPKCLSEVTNQKRWYRIQAVHMTI